jgi:hypothetical protein
VCVIPLLLHIGVGLIPTCLSVLGVASLEWRSVKKPAGEASAKNGEKGLVAADYLHVYIVGETERESEGSIVKKASVP